MSEERRHDLVIFDCDGVLVDSEVIAGRCLVEAASTLGIEINRDYVALHFTGHSFPVVGKVLQRDFGVSLPEDFEATYREMLLSAYSRELKAMPGIEHVLENLAVPFFLASSSSPVRIARSLEVVGLEHFFGGRTASAWMVPRGKPAPDLYLHVAERCGVRPERCLVIEDSIVGIEAGVAAGMEVWRYVGGSHISAADRLETGIWHGQFANYDQFFHLIPNLKLGK
ncbi:MAG: HAD family hydrolase [Pseudomonadota bacterium]